MLTYWWSIYQFDVSKRDEIVIYPRKIIDFMMVLRGWIDFFIKKSVFLSLVSHLMAISDGLSTRIPKKYPIRFNIESQKHGSLLKGKDRIDIIILR